MEEKEAKFLGEFFNLISKYNVSFGATEQPTYIYVGDRKIADIIESNGVTTINVNVEHE